MLIPRGSTANKLLLKKHFLVLNSCENQQKYISHRTYMYVKQWLRTSELPLWCILSVSYYGRCISTSTRLQASALSRRWQRTHVRHTLYLYNGCWVGAVYLHYTHYCYCCCRISLLPDTMIFTIFIVVYTSGQWTHMQTRTHTAAEHVCAHTHTHTDTNQRSAGIQVHNTLAHTSVV